MKVQLQIQNIYEAEDIGRLCGKQHQPSRLGKRSIKGSVTSEMKIAAFFELSIDGRNSCELAFSCGLASYQTGLLAEDLIEEADHSLFRAKSRGRNRVVAVAAGRGLPMVELVH